MPNILPPLIIADHHQLVQRVALLAFSHVADMTCSRDWQGTLVWGWGGRAERGHRRRFRRCGRCVWHTEGWWIHDRCTVDCGNIACMAAGRACPVS